MSTNPLEILTEREQAVIQLLLQGKSNKSIARELRVGTRAIELHLTHIYEKLEVHSRTEAIIKLLRLLEKEQDSGIRS